MKHGKRYQAAHALIEKGKIYPLSEAVALIKKTSNVKFDASVELVFNLNINPTHADQQLRGAIVLPHGTGKTKKVLVITNTKQDEAKAAGADFVGFKDMLEQIQTKNWFDFDIIVATPDAMIELSKLGKILGPKGLMPNPKTGTVTTDVAKAVSEIKNGKVEYRNDKQGNLQLTVGKVSFDDKALEENIKTVVDTLLKIRPATVKGIFIKSTHISTTMGPSVKLPTEL